MLLFEVYLSSVERVIQLFVFLKKDALGFIKCVFLCRTFQLPSRRYLAVSMLAY